MQLIGSKPVTSHIRQTHWNSYLQICTNESFKTAYTLYYLKQILPSMPKVVASVFFQSLHIFHFTNALNSILSKPSTAYECPNGLQLCFKNVSTYDILKMSFSTMLAITMFILIPPTTVLQIVGLYDFPKQQES